MAAGTGADRIPPYNLDVERSVLGACLLDPDALLSVTNCLAPEDFYDPRHKLAFETIMELMRAGRAVDSLTFTEAISKRGDEERIGGQPFIASLLDAVTTTANAQYHADIVRDKSVHRRLITVGADIARMGYDDETDSGDALKKAEEQVFAIANSKNKPGIVDVGRAMKIAMGNLENRLALGQTTSGVPTGFKDFDKKFGGLQGGGLYILAARPGMGKTAFALNIAQYAAKEENLPVLIFSLEMTNEQLVLRMVASEAEVNLVKMTTSQKATNDQWKKLEDAVQVLSRGKVFIDDSPTLSTTEMTGRCRRFFAKHDVKNGRGLIILDYLQLMHVSSKRIENRVTEVSEISRTLKAVAKEFNVPVLALSQLSRDVEKRPSTGAGEKKKRPRPQLSDLRDSGAIEQDADMVIFLYRDAYYDLENVSNDDTTEVIVAKNRSGATDVVKLVFFGEYTKFRDNYGAGYSSY